jgi:fucose 4-O-acetylase-like acetyltransferase
MATYEKLTKRQKRINWMDNLRTFIIFLVVLYHVGGVYEAAGLWGWFWIVDDPDTIAWVGILGVAIDTFIMATMFLISGYLTPASMENKTSWEFFKAKFMRLVVPWMIAVLTLIPLYRVIFLYSRGLPQEHWSTYFHITNVNSQNWLWFLPLLFTFDLVYLLLKKANIKFPNISLKTAVLVAFVIGLVYSFGIGFLVDFRSWTLTPLIDFENERLLVYFTAFLIGALCYRQNIFAQKPKSQVLYIVACSVAWIPVTLHIFARLFPILYPDGFEITPLYRLIWYATFLLSAFCMTYLMVETFWRYFDSTSRLLRELSRNSYGVYIIHVVVIGVFGTLLLNTNLPAVVKYLLLVLTTYAGSNLLVSAYRSVRESLKLRNSKTLSSVKEA